MSRGRGRGGQQNPTYVLTHTDPFEGPDGWETTLVFDALRGKQGIGGLQVRFYVKGHPRESDVGTNPDGRARKRIAGFVPGRTYLLEARLVGDDSIQRRCEMRIEIERPKLPIVPRKMDPEELPKVEEPEKQLGIHGSFNKGHTEARSRYRKARRRFKGEKDV